MVVVPTEQDVTLTYGLTGIDWLGRFVTVLGLVGLFFLVRWKGASRFAADPPAGDETGDGDGGDGDGDREPPASGFAPDGEHEPPERTEPEPALP
jgi:hypothetical protein